MVCNDVTLHIFCIDPVFLPHSSSVTTLSAHPTVTPATTLSAHPTVTPATTLSAHPTVTPVTTLSAHPTVTPVIITLLTDCTGLSARSQNCEKQPLASSSQSAPPSVWNNSAHNVRIFMKICISVFLEDLSRQFKFH